MPAKNLSQWLSYLETLHPNAIELGLTRVKQVADALDLSKPASYVVTVTGTNGKGTCVTSLAAIYKEAGYQVGAYTSPHLWCFTERVAINGVSVPEAILCDAFTRIEAARGNVSLTYFEFTTLAALLIFQEADLDIAILEVGMGGRLDAVNIIDPDVAVITTVDLDHEQWLGDTREKIAYEKAGIMRAGCPVIVGRDLPQIIYDEAQKLDCPIYTLGKSFEINLIDPNNYRWESEEKIFVDIPKNHLLVDNIALSLKVIAVLLDKLHVSNDSLTSALRQCVLPGRQQVIKDPVWQIFDVAHNPQGVVELSAALQATTKKEVKTVAVFSMLRDKAVGTCVKAIAPFIDEWHVAGLEVDRGMTTEEVATAVAEVTENPLYQYTDITEAYRTVCARARDHSRIGVDQIRIVVFGSFHTVALVLPKEPKR